MNDSKRDLSKKQIPEAAMFLKVQKKMWETMAFHGSSMIEASGWFSSNEKNLSPKRR